MRLDPDMYHSQVVGKIAAINRNLENIKDELEGTTVAAYYAKEQARNGQKFEEIQAASIAGQCDDLDILTQKSFVLQELTRLITLLRPNTMSKELIDSTHREMSKHRDLWKSAYHHQLNTLEKLETSCKSLPSPGKQFLEAVVAKLKQHIAEHGISEKDVGAQQLVQAALSFQEIGHKGIDAQYALFKKFVQAQTVESPFENILDNSVQQQIVDASIEHISNQVTNSTLKIKLKNLAALGSINKSLFKNIDQILEEDRKLQDLAKTQLKDHHLSTDEIDAIILEALKDPTQNMLERAALLININLLIKAYPEQKAILDRIKEKGSNELIVESLRSPEFFIQMIRAIVVDSKISNVSNHEPGIYPQLLDNLEKQLKQQPASSFKKMSLEQISDFINKHIESLGKKAAKRDEELVVLGVGYKTFGVIEEIVNNFTYSNDEETRIIEGFCSSIEEGKKTYFYDENQNVKQFEKIKPDDVASFFADCAKAGADAAALLSDNRSSTTIITDILKALANVAIYILTFGYKPQFFQPQQTKVDVISEAIKEIKEALEVTLQTIDQNATPDQDMALQ